MAPDTDTADYLRASRGSALRKARKAAALSAEELARFVNERTAGSDVTRHAIYSYEQGKVLLSREVGHRIADALHLHPGQLLLGDPDYHPARPGNLPHGSERDLVADAHQWDDPASTIPFPGAADAPAAAGPGLPAKTQLAVVLAARRALPSATVLVRLLRQERRGKIDISGYLDVFNLLHEDTRPARDSDELKAIQAFGDNPGNEAAYALTRSLAELHDVSDRLFKKLLRAAADDPYTLFEECQDMTEQLHRLTEAVRGHVRACTRRLPGVSMEED